MSSASDSPADAFNLEFRSCVDDAWYTARVLLDGDTLTVKLQDFPQSTNDEVFNPGDFATPEAVDEFRLRFRPLSNPLEDSECSKVVEGTKTCATFKEDGQVRFFDAIVEAVKSAEHSSDKCTCTFLIFWQHGPEEGNLTSTNIADLCLLSPGKLNSRVDYFINLAKENIRVASQHSKSDSREISLSKGLARDTQNSNSPTKSKSSSSGHRLQENEKARQFTGRGSTTEGRGRKYCQQSDQDKDMGGGKETGDHYYTIIIENMEKDLSPSSVIEFIHKQTSVTPQVYVFPSLSSETYARGAIILDCKRKLMKIYEFLNNPNHFIISLTGRPWVIAGSMQRTETPKMTFGSLLPTSQMSNWSLGCVTMLVLFSMLIREGMGIRFVIDREECLSHNVEYEGETVHVSFVVIKTDSMWHYSDEGADLVIKGPNGEQVHDIRGKTSEKHEFVAHHKGLYRFCLTNKSPYHETIDFDVQVGHFTFHDQHAKDEHFKPLLEQISKVEEALYNIRFEQRWLSAETDRQAIVNEGMSRRAVHKAIFESAALVGASVLQVYLLQRLFERKLGTSRV